MPVDWTGTIMIEGAPTGDGRQVDRGALRWNDGPWPLIWDRDDGDHTGMVVGSVTEVRRDDDLIVADGTLSDSDDEETRAAVARVRELLDEGAVGVSVGLDDVTVELRAPADLLAEDSMVAAIVGDVDLPVAPLTARWSAAAARRRVFDAATTEDELVDSRRVQQAFLWRNPAVAPTDPLAYQLGIADVVDDRLQIVPRAIREAATVVDRAPGLSDEDRRIVRARIARIWKRVAAVHEDWPEEVPFDDADLVDVAARVVSGEIIEAVVDARLRHLAIVDTPAVEDARISIVAAAAATAVRADWFTNPDFSRDDGRVVRQEAEREDEAVTFGCPLTVTDDGRVYGHAALWGRCHAGFTRTCVLPPRDGEYSRFLHGEAVPGVRTGPLTVGTTHATMAADAVAAMDHYSDTGRAVADVNVGEDRFGIWVAGALRDGVSASDVAALRGSSLSGDWRSVNGKYRLCGLLAVNQPGYLVQRAEHRTVITAGPCNCDADVEPDEWDTLAGRVDQTERVVADLLRRSLTPAHHGE